MNQIFIPADTLGLLLPAFQRLQLLNTKRSRATAIKTFCKTLQGLGLVKATREILGVSVGFEADGSYGLFINWRESGTATLVGPAIPTAQAEGPTSLPETLNVGGTFNPLEP